MIAQQDLQNALGLLDAAMREQMSIGEKRELQRRATGHLMGISTMWTTSRPPLRVNQDNALRSATATV